jgi:hypothetical protein
MTKDQIQQRAYLEWRNSKDIQQCYHTFEFYWWERYARVYQLPGRITATSFMQN